MLRITFLVKTLYGRSINTHQLVEMNTEVRLDIERHYTKFIWPQFDILAYTYPYHILDDELMRPHDM